MNYLFPVLMLLLGVALGGGAAGMVLRAKSAAAYERGRGESTAETAALAEKVVGRDSAIEELRNRLTEKDASVVDLQRQVTTLSTKAAELSHQKQQNSELDSQCAQIEATVKNHQQVKTQLQGCHAREEAITKLKAARSGPTAVMLELACTGSQTQRSGGKAQARPGAFKLRVIVEK